MRLAFLSAFFLLLFLPSANAQDERCKKFVPRILARNPQTLAQYLTGNLTSDEEKVCHIYTWMTHNIRYDVKKWLAFDYQKVPIKKILHRRKATCTGYADLFNELCAYAGVRSADVPGYTKNMHVDIVDTFYLDDHVWNAAYIDNQWKLYDATWDAGYVKYFKKTFFGIILYTVTLGRRTILKYKPHFKQRPARNYYKRSGNVFGIDHYPVRYEWQLTDTIHSLPEFRADSSFYFKRYNRPDADAYIEQQTEMVREQYFHQNQEEREIGMGFTGYSFNRKNHFGIAKSYALRGKKSAAGLDPHSEDTAQQRKTADTVLKHWYRVFPHLDTNVRMIVKQQKDLLSTNTQKKGILTGHYKKLYKSSLKVLNQGRNGIQICSRSRVNARGVGSASFKKYWRMARDNSFKKTNPASIPNPKDSTMIMEAIHAVDDSVVLQHAYQAVNYNALDSGYFNCIRRLTRHVNTSREIVAMEYNVIGVRFWYFDDLDYEIRRLKDTLMFYKFRNDSLLDTNGTFIVRRQLELINNIKKGINKQYSLLKARANLTKQLKKTCTRQSMKPLEEYNATLETMNQEGDQCNLELDKWRSRSVKLRQYCRKLKRSSREEMKSYRREKNFEYAVFLVRNQYIKRHARSLRKLSNALKKTVNTDTRKVETYRLQLILASKKKPK